VRENEISGKKEFFCEALRREAKMAYKSELATLFLLMGVLLAGCEEGGERSISKVGMVGSEEAKANLLKEIRRKYENPEAHYELGKLYLADGLWDKAEWEFNVALGFDPLHRRAQAGIVKTLLAANNPARARLASEMYMNQAGTSAEASLLLGQAFQKELLDEYALACYQQALGLAPNAAAIHKQIGYYYLAKNDSVRAEEYLRRSFQLDPYQPEVAGELGRLGVIVQIPRKIEKPSKKLEKALEEGQK
jgi:tetratricopeptide (TPR) repeat protein